jgi:acyl-CoA reductase-like NAD-dependent aldehyde dehydrogenase
MPDLTPMIIGDERRTAEAVTEVRSPFDGSIVGSVPRATERDLDDAVAIAAALHGSSAIEVHERAAILDRAAVALGEHIEDMARSIATEAAKPITTARVEAQRAVETFRFSAAVARSLTGETVPLDATATGVGHLGFTVRVPIGVVGAISPFNFPLNLVAHKVAPAIAAGCPVVLKPASATPLTALALAELLIDECGLPAGWLNVVTAPGAVADRLVTHPDVAMVTFTGSPEVGWSIRERAPRKHVGLELGNNAPVIVADDADVEAVAPKLATAGYGFAGQTCISVQRVYAHHDVHDALVSALVTAAEELVVGDPLDEATQLSALIDPGETDRVAGLISSAVADGGCIATGGGRDDDGILVPTVVTGLTADMDLCRQEAFGPVIGVAGYDDLGDAIAAANDTDYGLQAGIFTNRLADGLRAARELRFGGVTVNEVPTWRADQMPYGGIGDSGNTKEGPAWAAREMTLERMVVIKEDPT